MSDEHRQENEVSREKAAKWKSLALLEAITLGGGAAVGFLTRRDMAFYGTLAKPAFAPPAWLFPAAWCVLYAAMAAAAWLVWRAKAPSSKGLLTLYFVQFAVNLAWPVIFFTLKALGLAFWWLILLLGLVVALMVLYFRWSRAAGWLLVPYAAWTCFAAVLNFFVARMNP